MAAIPDVFPKSAELVDYDPEPARESIRGRITLAAAFTFFTVVSFYLIQSSRVGGTAWVQVKEAMQSVLPAVTSVLGTTLGFYFGSQKR